MHRNYSILLKTACFLAIYSLPGSTFGQVDSGKHATQPTAGAGQRDTAALGVAISPGKLKFTCKPGSTQSQTVTLTNHTAATYNFRTGFTDYVQNIKGKPLFNPGNAPKNKYALSKWATASPAFFTLEPGKSQKITITVNIPPGDSNNIAAWTIMEVDQVKKKSQIPESNNDNKTLSMGISPEIGLGVYVYQNPPNVKVNNIQIDRFYYRDTTYVIGSKNVPQKQLWLQVSNIGDGISYCTSYAEITNLQTGKTYRLDSQQFTILPGFDRQFFYEMPKDAAPGNYSAVGVVDFGDKTPKKVAQLNFTYK